MGPMETDLSVYTRPNSPYFWLLLPRPGQKPIRESTNIPKDAPTADGRRLQRQQAEEAYISRMRELAAARYDLLPDAKKDVPGFSKFAVWYDAKYTVHKRGAERERYIIASLKAFFSNTPLDKITSGQTQEYITLRTTDGLAASGINREVDLLKAMLKAAVGAGHIDASPIAGTKKLRVVKRRKRVLTQDEEDRVLTELQPDDRALYVIAVDTLIRLSNVLNLRWTEVTPTHLALHDSKTGPYEVPLSKRAKAALEQVPRIDPYVFPHRRTAKKERDRRGVIRRMLERACKRAGVPYGRAAGGVTFHTATRASGATRMLRAGTDPRTVQGVGHWEDFRSLQDYLETDDRLKQQAVNTIGAKSKVKFAKKKRRRESAKSTPQAH